MAPLRVSITKSEWLPDDLTAFVPLRLWKSPFITTWDGSQNQNHPTDSADQGDFSCGVRTRAPPRVLPVRLAELPPEDLVRPALEQLTGHEFDPPWRLVSRDPSPAIRYQLLLCRRCPVFQHHARHHQFAPFRIGNADYGDFFHARVRINGRLHFARICILEKTL